MSHPNERLADRHTKPRPGDVDAYIGLLSDDFVLHIPGRSQGLAQWPRRSSVGVDPPSRGVPEMLRLGSKSLPRRLGLPEIAPAFGQVTVDPVSNEPRDDVRPGRRAVLVPAGSWHDRPKVWDALGCRRMTTGRSRFNTRTKVLDARAHHRCVLALPAASGRSLAVDPAPALGPIALRGTRASEFLCPCFPCPEP